MSGFGRRQKAFDIKLFPFRIISLNQARMTKTLPLKEQMRRILKFFGSPPPVVDLTSNISIDPISIINAYPRHDSYMHIPVDRIRMGQMAFPASFDSPSYVVKTAKEYYYHETTDINCTSLTRFYSLFQPKNASEMMDVPSRRLDNDGFDFTGLTPLEVGLPWKAVPGKQVRDQRRDAIRRDALQFGINLSSWDSTTSFGPAPKEVIEMEYYRIKMAINNVVNKGVDMKNAETSPITGTLLLDERNDTYAVLIGDGNHRVAACAALDYTSIPLVLKRKAVRSSEVLEWPGVKSGHFSPYQAITVFNRVVSGRQPKKYEIFMEKEQNNG